VTTQTPGVLSLLDQAGAANRAGIRQDLTRHSRLDREGLAALIVLEFLALALALRMRSCGPSASCATRLTGWHAETSTIVSSSAAAMSLASWQQASTPWPTPSRAANET
jgi:hypothetical protein